MANNTKDINATKNYELKNSSKDGSGSYLCPRIRFYTKDDTLLSHSYRRINSMYLPYNGRNKSIKIENMYEINVFKKSYSKKPLIKKN